MAGSPKLVATYYTLAGPVEAGGADVSPFDLTVRADAAARAGYAGLGLSGNDLGANVARYGYEGIRSVLRDTGLHFLEIECLTGWFVAGERRAASDRLRRLWLDAARRIGVQHIKVAEEAPDSDWTIPHMAENFRLLCDEAAEAGVYVSIEIFPVSNIRDIRTALAISEMADCDNGGMLVDIWHITRFGIDYAEIAAAPVRYLKHIELNDANAQMIGSLLEDTVKRRKLPGEGAFDIPAFLRSVRATGYDGYYGVEIISDENRERSPADAARLSFDATMTQFSKLAQ